MFKKIRELAGKFTAKQSKVIKEENGEIVSEQDQVSERWKEYTRKLYEKDVGMPESDLIDISDIDPEPSILHREVEEALKEIASRKAPGYDDIPIEFWKELGENGMKTLTRICQNIWEKKKWPEDWKRSLYIPIPKKGDILKCENHRTIALI
ncbi:uncharacterized protein LOC122259441 [Penaeus japonicus]|uniref:uncharacterized protein LOC122259441 n=1 Tax=Penaeus japonicus TaxID=27405 RepID=UPI001C71066A|nr:uncharacterized protein LOC122259441 [Penaeus japonicus]